MRRRAAVAAAGLLVLTGGCGGSTTLRARQTLPALGSLQSDGAGHRFYEIYGPVGRVRGTILMIHPGGWKDQRGDARRYMATAALALRAVGWRVVNISYSSGQAPVGGALNPARMLGDVVAFYDQVRRVYGGPICAYGDSAGGNLAAMLALKRPSLKCAILNAAPLDLTTLVGRTLPVARSDIRVTFGTRRSVLDQWSPARQWRTRANHTAVFATVAANDAVVPPQQLDAFTAADPSANADVVAGSFVGSPDAVQWEHSVVNRAAIDARVENLVRWLGRFAADAPGPPPTNVGADCNRLPPPGDRWKLLLAGDAWQQESTAREPIAATRGCSGSSSWQDDGLSLWALPSVKGVLPTGAQASLVLQTPNPVHALSVSFRGFLARPEDWQLGLYVSTSTQGPIQTPVAACVRGNCSGLRLVQINGGALIAPSNSTGNPDTLSKPPTVRFALPADTRRIAWQLSCAASAGCSQAGIAHPPGRSLRPRDPLGHPAIFSLYSAQVD